MIGDKYWATGISLKYGYAGSGRNGWVATINFLDSGFCEDKATEGRLHTRYFVDLETAIDTVLADADHLGIEVRGIRETPNLYVQGDGEDQSIELPSNWRELLQEQSDRLGWRCLYKEQEVCQS